MFTDVKYDCILIKDVHDELIQTQKFKAKYPWTRTCRPYLKVTNLSPEEKKCEDIFFRTVGFLCESKVNTLTGRMFDLSREDKKVISHTLALRARISTGDINLSRFMKQEYPLDYQGELSALEVLNVWIENRLVKWMAEKQTFLEDWARNDEPAQTYKAIKRFRALTGVDYIGP